MIEDPEDERLPVLAREALGSLVEQLRMAQAQSQRLEKKLLAWHRSNEASRRLAAIPGVGVIAATALVVTVGDASQFRSGRQLAAWLGLVPRQHSSGGKERLGRISKRGDGYRHYGGYHHRGNADRHQATGRGGQVGPSDSRYP
jgi:transposase